MKISLIKVSKNGKPLIKTTKQKVIIRVDGNSDIGLGHIYRGIALPEMLKNEFDADIINL